MPTTRPRKPPARPARLFLAVGLVAVAATTVLLSFQMGPGWAYLAAVNVVNIAAYGYDKAASIRKWLRVPESVLHLLAGVGGTPAAFAAQQLLRHKTLKPSFQRRFRLVAAAQVALLLLLLWWRWGRHG